MRNSNMLQKLGKKVTTAMLAMALACTGMCSAQAADQEPNPVASTYTVKDIHGEDIVYFNVDSTNFSRSPELFYRDLLTGRNQDVGGGKSIDDLWQRAGLDIYGYIPLGMLVDANTLSKDDVAKICIQKEDDAQPRLVELGDENRDVQVYRFPVEYYKSLSEAEGQNYGRLLQANDQVYEDIEDEYPLKGRWKFLGLNEEEYSKEQPVFSSVVFMQDRDEQKRYAFLAVYYTDFQIVPLFPDASEPGNYVTTVTETTNPTDGDIIASNVMNLSAGTITTTQNISTSHSASVTSTVNGSTTYSLTEGIKVGQELNLFKIGKTNVEVNVSATEAFQHGWSKAEAVTDSSSTSSSVSVTLPPYTQVVLKQSNTNSRQITKYNCPIALKYKVYLTPVFHYNGMFDTACCFGAKSGDARADLLERAILNSELSHYDNTVPWHRAIDFSTIDLLAHRVPMAGTGALFDATLNTVSNQVDRILPVYPLTAVTLGAPSGSYISDQPLTYGKTGHLIAEMKVGDTSYTSYLTVNGYNAYGGEYYGFSKMKGHWIVTDSPNAAESMEDGPVVLEKNAVSGNVTYKAMKPGTCYLKYIIDEDVYNTATNPEIYAKNSDLKKTAVLQINVSEKLKYVRRVEPTCEKDGHIAYYKSEKTGKIFEDKDGKQELTKEDVVLECTGHEWSAWETDEAKSTDGKIVQVRTCKKNADHVQTRTVDTPAKDTTAAERPTAAVKTIKTDQYILLQAKSIKNKSFTLKWTRLKDAGKYVIYGGDCGDALTKLCTVHSVNTSKVIKSVGGAKLKANHYYKFFIVAYGKDAYSSKEIGRSQIIHLLTKNSKKYANMSKISLTTAKSIRLKKGNTAQVNAKQIKAKGKKVYTHIGVRYYSTNTSVAKVNKKTGVVKGVGKGSCIIYCLSQNGLYKKVSVKVS